MTKDRWPELCRLVEKDDGLPTWEEAGHWTLEKLNFWHRYLEITTKAMVDNPVWRGGVVYVDLFAGAGICTLKDSGKRIPGSVLLTLALLMFAFTEAVRKTRRKNEEVLGLDADRASIRRWPFRDGRHRRE